MGNSTSCSSQNNIDTLLPSGEPITITMNCDNLGDKNKYGLTSWDVIITATETSTGFVFTVLFHFNGGTAFILTAQPYTGSEVVFFTNVQGPNPISNNIAGQISGSIFTVIIRNGKNVARYDIQIFFAIRGPAEGTPMIRADMPVMLMVSTLDSVSVPQSPNGTDSIPNIIGVVNMTSDLQICQVNYNIVDQPFCYTKRTSSYVQYSPDISRVLLGPGCTIASKTNDVLLLVQYSILRMILSSILFENCFMAESLRRRYYKNFLSRLKNSEYSAFLEYFTDPKYGVTDYWLLFKE